MKRPITRKERAEHLFEVITSQRFLTKQGLGNEVPFFICPYIQRNGEVYEFLTNEEKDVAARSRFWRSISNQSQSVTARTRLIPIQEAP